MYVHGHALFICQFPNCNLFTQHAYSYGRDASSELWTPVHSFTSNTIYCNTRSTVLCKHHHPHYTSNPLLQQAGEIDNLTVSLGQSTLVVLCRFHVGAGISGVAPHYIQPPSTFNVLLGSYWFDKPWFLTEGKLAAVRITPSSWGSQRTCELHAIKHIFWRRCRGDQDTLQGESPHFNIFTLFLSCFILFTTLFAALNQNTKKKLVASFNLFAILFAISKTQKN